MSTRRPANGSNGTGGKRRRGLRRVHRWAGIGLFVFLIFLALTGIALNHSTALGLDKRHVSSTWLLNAYGIEEREPLPGMVRVGALVAVADVDQVHVLTNTGVLVESIDVANDLGGPIRRIGRLRDRVVIDGSGRQLISDADVMQFDRRDADGDASIDWSNEVDASIPELESLQVLWRGPGVTVERVLLDLHSGRLLRLPGKLLLDLVGVGFLLLAFTGLVLTRKKNRRR